MSHNKAGKKKDKPSHLRYKSENHRRRNKLRRVTKFCGEAFSLRWLELYG
jgi:hypothetical protein